MAMLDPHVLPRDLEPLPRHHDSVVDGLLTSPLFNGMPREEIVACLRNFDEDRFEAGHRLTLQGLRGSDFFVIVRGQAGVVIDDHDVAALGPGDFFGEVGVMDEGLRTATVIARTPLHCLVLPHRGLEPLLVQHPQLSVNLLRQVLSRFRSVSLSAHAGREPSAGPG